MLCIESSAGLTFRVFWHGQCQPAYIHTELAGNAGVSAWKSDTWNSANHQRHFNHQFLSTRNMDINLCVDPQIKQKTIMRPQWIAAPRSYPTPCIPQTVEKLGVFSAQIYLANTLAAFLTFQQLPSFCSLSLDDIKKINIRSNYALDFQSYLLISEKNH